MTVTGKVRKVEMREQAGRAARPAGRRRHAARLTDLRSHREPGIVALAK